MKKGKFARNTWSAGPRRWLARNGRRLILSLYIMIMATMASYMNFPMMRGPAVSPVQVSGEALSYKALKQDLSDGKVARASLVKNSEDEWTTVIVTYKSGQVDWVSIPATPELANVPAGFITSTFQTYDIPVSIVASKPDKPLSAQLFGFVLTLMMMLGASVFLYFIAFSGKDVAGAAVGMGGSRKKSDIRFTDVAGIEEAKADLVEIVDFIKNPDKYEAAGARPPRGVLLAGPPGTGKTLLAKAVAGESKAALLAFSPNDFSSPYIGVGKMKVKGAFASAREQAPAILFIDEIDTLTRKRGHDHREYDAVINEVLLQMDGFDGREGVIVIGATNRVDTMDPAILRPGRFDRIVNVGLPDVEGRSKILAVHTESLPLAADIDLVGIARRTVGYSGAQLENLANEAALSAARADRKVIETHDFDAALDKLMLGARRESLILTEDERATVIVHEAGHALCAALLPDSDPIERVTIIPHGQSLGAVVRAPQKDRVFASLARLKADLVVAMAGRAAEHVYFGPDKITNGAAADIEGASVIAMHMICTWGMSDAFGMVAIPPDPKDREVQREVARMTKDAFEQAVKMIEAQRPAFDRLVSTLESRETLGRGEVERIIHLAPEAPSALMAAE